MKPFNEHEEPRAWDFKTGQHLHGDVVIEKIKSLPENFDSLKSEPMDALAYGEQSGHIHKLFRISDVEGLNSATAFQLKVDESGVKFLKVLEPVVLKHQEHLPRIIPPGNYKIGIQREYDPFSKIISRVQD